MGDTQNTCQFPLCTRHAEANGFCLFHRQYSAYAGELKDKTTIEKKSDKQEKLDREYKKIVKEMLAVDDRCELGTPVCTKIATGLHHMKRRGVNLLNRKYLKRACNACNGWVEKNPKQALELGMSVLVHKKEEQ